AAAACALYAVIAALAQRRRPWALWMFVLVAVWAVLVVSAPSFAWCSFALFFLCRIAFTGAVAYAAAGATAAATAAGLFRLSDGTDLAMLLGPLAVGVLLTLIYDRIEHDAAEQRRLHREVSLAQGQLAASERRAGTIAERERVSREIHDTVTQGLASSLLLLEAANRAWPAPASRQDLRQASELLRRNLSDTRSLVHELASPGLDASPLPDALLQAASQYVPGARLLVTGDSRPVAAEVRHTLLRVVQSAAANIKLHASADTATITLGFLPEAVTLDIYDDGTGFDPAAVAPPSDAGGYGLRAMRQRVEQLGGAFSVESAPGEGTVVAAQLPAPLPVKGEE
ncbi:MAG TPA: histidine kinase, partial [Arthrobacter sp.]|nr:histidine kinase [Arthrobacter sp.]